MISSNASVGVTLRHCPILHFYLDLIPLNVLIILLHLSHFKVDLVGIPTLITVFFLFVCLFFTAFINYYLVMIYAFKPSSSHSVCLLPHALLQLQDVLHSSVLAVQKFDLCLNIYRHTGVAYMYVNRTPLAFYLKEQCTQNHYQIRKK